MKKETITVLTPKERQDIKGQGFTPGKIVKLYFLVSFALYLH